MPESETKTEAVLRGARVQVGDEFIVLELQEASVLQALVDLRAAMTQQLIDESGYSDAVRVLGKLRNKFPALKPYIEFPGGRGKGGYKTTIRSEK